ncbi:MAG: nicotinate (nicotinamide) nucleotide adenylyltransferase [Ruminococcus sp.]|nr:nicotinate (nicotinamide) nucleotide adenylyltransferase [Ruminococcus sp.]
MKRIGIFGGTFNPIHKGHIKCIEEIDKELGFDKILVIPTKIPPHKQAVDLASDNDRFNMCRLATKRISNAEVSDIEIKSEGKSYSVLTLRKLILTYPKSDYRLYFLMGSDMLLCFEKWFEFRDILSLCSLVCITRNSDDKLKIKAQAEKLRDLGGEIIIVNTEPLEISSSEIRDLIRKGEDLSCFLDDAVVKYISESGIYGK